MAIKIQERIALASFTTLQCGGEAEYFVTVASEEELIEAVTFAKERNLRITILGGGSNVLLSDNGLSGLVIHICIQSIEYSAIGTSVQVRVGAGITLDSLVEETVEKKLWGLENLSGIPGSVGAVPIQNVGAYGVEAKDVVSAVHAFNIDTETFETLNAPECLFTYRHSFFKTEAGRRYIICAVTFILHSVPTPRVTYKDLLKRFEDGSAPQIGDIRNTVLAIRSEKFPDWRVVGTAGSFFKNPILSHEAYGVLQTKFPLVPGFAETGGMKVSLGWILDHVLNLKGYREGNVGLYEKQALVLITYGSASSDEVLNFAERIRGKVFDATGIHVEFEAVYVA